jgi:hypothetical protein
VSDDELASGRGNVGKGAGGFADNLELVVE